MGDWSAIGEREAARYRDGELRLPEADDADARQRQLTRTANAAWGAGLAALGDGRVEDAARWLLRAAARYRESWEGAPAESWGRPIAAMKARILARAPAETDATWALDAGAAEAASPIGRYAAALALLLLGRDAEARVQAEWLCGRGDFPPSVAQALAALAATDAARYEPAVRDVLASFERRDGFLEDVPLADTVLVLQALARTRDIAAELPASRVLP